MAVKILDELHDSLLDEAWNLYREAFEELNTLAVQRHLMYRSEFDDVMHDRRVQKYLCIDDDGVLSALATYTNDLDAVPLISPQYFERRWPRRYAEHRIWYIGFIAVSPDGKGAGDLVAMVADMHAVASARKGVVGLDVCRYNGDVRHMGRSMAALVQRLSDNAGIELHIERADEQSYWLYEFPPAA